MLVLEAYKSFFYQSSSIDKVSAVASKTLNQVTNIIKALRLL